MKIKTFVVLISVLFQTTFLLSGINPENVLPDNSRKWEIYTDMKNVISIAMSRTSNTAFCATDGGIFSVDLNNGNILQKYTNLNGLINNNVTTVATDIYNRLWIGASDGSISIYDIDKKSWRYIYDIKNSNESNKSINDFMNYNNFIYVATSYGIHKISVTSFNFIDAPYSKLGTFSINTKVTGLAFARDTIFASTVVGIAYAPLSSNLNSPLSWSNYNIDPLDENVNVIEQFDNLIFAGSQDGFWYYNFATWQPYPYSGLATAYIRSAVEIGDRFFISTINEAVFVFRGNLINLYQYYQPGIYNVIYKDNQNNPILGENENGIIYQLNGQFQNYFPNGPNRNLFNYITEDDKGNIWGAGASSDAGFYKYDGKTWTSYTTATHPEIGNSNNFTKIICGNGNIWAINFGSGPTIIRPDNTIKNYNPSNSNLPGIQNFPNFCVPNGGAYDNKGVFWISFYQQNSDRSLYVYTGDSIFTGFANPPIISYANLEEVAIDAYNTKWIVSGELPPRGLYFFNENNTLNEPGDDVYGIYQASELGVNDISDVIVDKNNEVWFATNNGVFIINNPLAAIQNPQQKPTPIKLGIISGGLKVPFTENCRCISIDILNQKWIGTELNGVFHLSEDGSTLIEQFNTTNSPIADNRINGIVISPLTGKAYFATLKGLSSITTDAIKPVNEFDKITCSPNPYLVPNYTALKIDGLVENSSVKIITLNGEIIREFDTPGGRIATWDGLDLKGNIVSSGIYIVVAFNKDGSKVGKGKIAVVRK
ncbi:MAG: hypothetical protein JW917_07885 [Ignavibacteria bacterium]|nr:hypothetical protein [Ignavibacteria bacterium]